MPLNELGRREFDSNWGLCYFQAFTGFFHVMDFLNLTAAHNPGDVTLEKFTKVVEDFCAKDWDEV
jgi:hypothetical protein